MPRSIINSIFLSLLIGGLFVNVYFLITQTISWTALLIIPVLFMVIKRQAYIYQHNNHYYFRRIPFTRGILISSLNDIEDLRIIETAKNTGALWQFIQKINRSK
jgi:hypothetical protein